MAEKSVEHLLLCANVLIAAYQHNDLDRKSDRGRYIYSALIQYSLLQDANYKDNLLVRLYKCDFMAVLGGIGRAGDCYDEIIAQMTLQISFGDTNNTSHTTVTYGTIIKDYSALQCMRTHKAASTDNEHQYSIELLRCHQHCAIMRQLRHSLIHQLDPSRALDIATQNSHLLTVKGCKVWTLLALCMLGYCHSGQVFYTTESSLLSVHTEVSYRNATLNIGVPVSTTVAECDVILAYLSAHGDNEVVHTLFTKLCFVFRRVHHNPTTIDAHQYRLFDSTQSYTDHSRSVINSLLSVGAVEAAALHTVHFTHNLLVLTDNVTPDTRMFTSELAQLYHDYPSISALLHTEVNNGISSAILLESSNVRSALTLSTLLRTIISNNNYLQAFAHNSDLLSNFISVLFHATSPVILSLPPVVTYVPPNTTNDNDLDYICLQEAILLRVVLINGLRQLNTLCDSLCPNCCTIVDPTSNIGGRGLFLLAYQGVGLIQESVRKLKHQLCSNTIVLATSTALAALCTDTGVNNSLEYIISDKSVPELYAQLIQRTSNHKIGEFEQSDTTNTANNSRTAQYTHSINSTTTTTNNSRIKVGFVSFFFRRHPVGRLLSKIITHLDTALFDVYLIIQ